MHKTVLLVDDDPLFVQVVKDLLEIHHYRVMTAPNGSEALLLLKSQSVDIVVSDIEMPVMNGIAFHARLVENNLNGHIPFVFLTSTDDQDKVNYVRRFPHVVLIHKSDMVEELIQTITRLTTRT